MVIPCYNEQPANLRQAVSAALSQGDGVEVIVVDDGSNEPGTLRALRDLETTVIRTENRGLPAARNTGIQAGTGRSIFPLDSDDVIEPGHVRVLAEHMDSEDSTTIACTAWQEFGGRSSLLTPPNETTAGEMAGRCTILAASMFRRSDWEMLGGYDEDAREAAEDWEWWVRLLLARGGVARIVPGLVHHYRIRSGSMNVKKHEGVNSLILTRNLMLRNNPGHAEALARAVVDNDLSLAYSLGQHQSPFAEAATAITRHYERRYGRVEGLIARLAALGGWRRR